MNDNNLPVSYLDLLAAHQRIKEDIHRTPIVESSLLNQWLGHRVLFKAECLQKVGAFKARGGLNAVSHLDEQSEKPKLIIANSSGNHAQAVAWAAQKRGIPCRIYMPEIASKIKQQATKSYGAEVVTLATRQEVDQITEEHGKENGVAWIPPYNHEDVIAGQGTAAMEALTDLLDQDVNVDGVFAPCGGGGLVSGTYVATRKLAPAAKIIGVEPLAGNDAAESRRQGRIVSLSESPNTLADGARTLSVGHLTFPFIQRLDEFFEIEEEPMKYWSQWLGHLLKLRIEPTSAMSMEAVVRWLSQQSGSKTVLVILTGGNIDHQSLLKLQETDYLLKEPSLNLNW